MALSKIDAANFLDGTLPDTNINNASLDNVTGLPAGVGGKILQVVEGSSTTQHEATGSANQDIGLSVNITPSATSSKIYVVADFLYSIFQSGEYGSSAQFAVLRDSTTIIAGSGGSGQDYNVEASALSSNNYVTMAGINTMQILDAPSSTSQITYKVQSTGVTSTRVRSMLNGVRGSIVAMEVSG
jgi:hypothetical protein